MHLRIGQGHKNGCVEVLDELTLVGYILSEVKDERYGYHVLNAEMEMVDWVDSVECAFNLLANRQAHAQYDAVKRLLENAVSILNDDPSPYAQSAINDLRYAMDNLDTLKDERWSK